MEKSKNIPRCLLQRITATTKQDHPCEACEHTHDRRRGANRQFSLVDRIDETSAFSLVDAKSLRQSMM